MAPLTAFLLAASLASAAGGAAAEPARIRVLTMNAAALPGVHPRVGARLDALGRGIAEGGYDVVGLQEAWRDSDSERVAEASGLPHAARPKRAFPVSSGLTILSRWPIAKIEEKTFSALRPSWLNVGQGEPAARKGILLARVDTPWGELDAYAAHMTSNYRDNPSHEALRLTEMFELAEFVLDRSAGRPFVIMADLNAGYGRRDFDLFMDLLGARDACREKGKELCGDPRRKGARIDYVLLPPGGPRAAGRRVFDGDLPGFSPPTPYSDHSGYAADLVPAHLQLKPSPDPKRRAAALAAADAVFSRMIERLNARAPRLSWIPFYGGLVSARYARQIGALSALRERASTPRK